MYILLRFHLAVRSLNKKVQSLALQAYLKKKFSSTLISKIFFKQFYLVLAKTLMNYKLLCLETATAKELKDKTN